MENGEISEAAKKFFLDVPAPKVPDPEKVKDLEDIYKEHKYTEGKWIFKTEYLDKDGFMKDVKGILLGIASFYPREFNQARCAPKDENGNVRRFPDWTLNNLIDGAAEIGFLKQDVKKFSHVVRDFRNYIHPYSQMSSGFTPDKQTAMICLQVLKAAINQIGDYRKRIP